jgi:branched-chain amino acid transport system substrate-binding protein
MSKDQTTSTRRRWYRGATALAIAGAMGIATGFSTTSAMAQGKTLKIGVIYDLTGPFAAGGSRAGYLGTKYAIDMINERGGVEGYKIVPVYADAQSKTEVAINEAERLLNRKRSTC